MGLGQRYDTVRVRIRVGVRVKVRMIGIGPESGSGLQSGLEVYI